MRLNSSWWCNYRVLQRIISSLSHQFSPILIAIATQLSQCSSKPLHVSWLILIQQVLQNLYIFLGALPFERWEKEKNIFYNIQNAVACKQCLMLYKLAPVLSNEIIARKPKCCLQRLCSFCLVLLVEPSVIEVEQLMVLSVFLKTRIFFENK